MKRTLLLCVLALIVPSTLFAQTETVEYYGYDAIGSVRIVFDGAGNVLARVDYEPFGREITPPGNAPDRKFAGLFRDSEAGLDYAEARSYQVRTGRFNSPDPVSAGLFEPQRWNRYGYALNNPLTLVDPTGLRANDCRQVTTEVKTETGYDVKVTFQCDASGGGGGYPVIIMPPPRMTVGTDTADEPPMRGPGRADTAALTAGVVAAGAVLIVADGLLPFGDAAAGVLAGELAGGSAAATVAAAATPALQNAARQAVSVVGPGNGAAYGTRVHKVFEVLVKGLNDPSLSTEVSYLNGQLVLRGTPGSVRLDVVTGPLQQPLSIFDLKTGNAILSSGRIHQIQSHVPGGSNVPVLVIRP